MVAERGDDAPLLGHDCNMRNGLTPCQVESRLLAKAMGRVDLYCLIKLRQASYESKCLAEADALKIKDLVNENLKKAPPLRVLEQNAKWPNRSS